VLADLRVLARTCLRYTIRYPKLAPHFWSVFLETARRNPDALDAAVTSMIVYLHLYPFSRHVIREIDARIAEIDAGTWTEPATLPAAGAACAREPLPAVA
jgi:hypothetical protein